MTQDAAGSVPSTTNHTGAGTGSSEHRSTVAGIVLSAVVSAFHSGGDQLTMGTLADVVEGVLTITDGGPLRELELHTVVMRLVERELLDRRGDDIVLGVRGRPALAAGGLA